MAEGPIEWAGVRFWPVYHHDGRLFREPGLFGFARAYPGQGRVLLFAGHSELLARDAGPSHPYWVEALRLGMNELHVLSPVEVRVDRLQLLSRVITRVQPLLNVLDDVRPPIQVGVAVGSRRVAS